MTSRLYALADWATATLPQDSIVVALEFRMIPPDASTRTLRLTMTRAQCAELARALEQLAETPPVTPSSEPS